MASSDAQAVIILIDNSETTINGDFYPNRLDAEKIATSRLSQYLSRSSAKTQISIGTIGSQQFGIQSSLTTKYIKTSQAVAQAKRGGVAELEHGIRCAFLALRHRNPEITTRRVIAFIGSHHTLTAQAADKLAADANREGVSVDIVAFGDDVNDIDVLEEFTKKIQAQSYFVHAQPGTVILSDIVLSSPIGPGEGSAHTVLDPNAEEDPDVALAIRQSLENSPQANEEAELEAAIRESLQNIEEPDMREAIRLSLLEQGPPQQEPKLVNVSEIEKELNEDENKPQQEQAQEQEQDDDDFDMDSPELQEAIRLSKEVNQPDDQQNEEQGEAHNDDNENQEQKQEEEEEEDEELKRAKQESIEVNQFHEDIQKELDDPETLHNILSSLTGVNPDDETFKKNDKDQNKQ